MATAKHDYKIEYKAYTHSGDRMPHEDFSETINKGDKIHNNRAEMLKDPSRYDWGMMRGGFKYYGTCTKI